MSFDIKKAEYFNITIDGYVGEGSRLLSIFSDAGISLLAFKAVALDPNRTLFTLFPNDNTKMIDQAKKAGLELDGPHPALILQGNDESGALAEIYEKLSQAGIMVKESSGIADIKGWYGVILYIEQKDCIIAARALGI